MSLRVLRSLMSVHLGSIIGISSSNILMIFTLEVQAVIKYRYKNIETIIGFRHKKLTYFKLEMDGLYKECWQYLGV